MQLLSWISLREEGRHSNTFRISLLTATTIPTTLVLSGTPFVSQGADVFCYEGRPLCQHLRTLNDVATCALDAAWLFIAAHFKEYRTKAHTLGGAMIEIVLYQHMKGSEKASCLCLVQMNLGALNAPE